MHSLCTKSVMGYVVVEMCHLGTTENVRKKKRLLLFKKSERIIIFVTKQSGLYDFGVTRSSGICSAFAAAALQNETEKASCFLLLALLRLPCLYARGPCFFRNPHQEEYNFPW